MISKYQDLGPPDLCYLEIETYKKSKYLKKYDVIPGMRRGFYHYVFGADTSSSAYVAAYIKDCINIHTSQQNIN